MEENITLLNEELIFLDFESANQEELLKELGNFLYSKGYVKESYVDGIIQREKVFPTGLNTLGVAVAIPHTDAKHVNKSALLVAKLKNPICFKEMGNGINDVYVKLIFMLAIKNPDEQLKTLSKLMSIFSEEKTLLNIYNAKIKKDIFNILNDVMLR